MKVRRSCTATALVLSFALLALVLVVLPSLAAPSVLYDSLHDAATTQPTRGRAADLYVATTGTDSGDCTDSDFPCRTVQYTVDQASEGSTIKVASGVYTDIHQRASITQVVYISKTVTVRGGYATGNWTTSDPENNPTTLDAQEQGRVLYVTGDISPTVEGLRITGGDATGLDGYTSWWATLDAGGGVCVISATATISNNQVFSNAIKWGGGGGLYLYSSASTLSGNVISSNTVSWAGGGVLLHLSPARLSGNVISSNTAGEWGGGLLLTESDAAILSNNTIISNTADLGGGGLYIEYGSVTLSGNVIARNTTRDTTGSGGGVCLFDGNHTLNNNVIASNAAGNGGGIQQELGDSILSGNVISGNTANYSGGGLSLSGNSAILSENTVVANTAHRDGGGLLLGVNETALSRNAFLSNAARSGGGLYLASRNAVLTNNVVADNHISGKGAGMYVMPFSPRMLHTTVARNTGGDGSGVYVTNLGEYYNTIALTNTILVSHTVGISVTGNNTATLNGVLWHDTPITVSRSITSFVNVQNQHIGDPDFVDADSGDYHISPGSAAQDAGVDAGVAEDIDGDPRVDGRPDIGADELVPALAVTKRADPDPVEAGARLTYTIRVTNTGQVDLHATITDTLPAYITQGETSGGTLILPGGVVTWTPVIIAPDGVWTDTVVVTVTEDYEGPLINVVEIATEEGATGIYTETSTVTTGHSIHLPLVLSNWALSSQDASAGDH